MSAVVLNVAVGLVTSIISGGSVWAWGRVTVTRRQREQARFFGVSAGDTCRIIAPEAFGTPRTVSKNDMFSIVELAKLMRDLRADLDVAGADERAFGVGDVTEFCVGGPAANVRMRSHLARFLPGVTVTSASASSPVPSVIAVGGQEFVREPGSRDYVLVARLSPPGGRRPLFLICGQTAIANRAAASYLRDRYRAITSAHDAGENWCVILRVLAPGIYGHHLAEFAADLSASAFSRAAATESPV